MADGRPVGSSVQIPPGSPVGGSHDSGGDQSPRSGVREQDRFLPIANISRIMKKALPANGKVAKDAKETVQECVSEFISFVTSEYGSFSFVNHVYVVSFAVELEFQLRDYDFERASDKCQREKRKTINGDDLLWAMATLGFEDYIDPLKMYLARYREGDTKGSAKSADVSARKDGLQSTSSSQLVNQGSYSQGMNYGHSQVHFTPAGVDL
ncbi:nuclear transcription factor Y subunit B-10-like [Dorcoceras hygrometricum]|uniref:Nuclear transcription factor Y subunit B-10-like n=1 Tax=Dorcoceras hygrometricum TaxID=472368 RepID=A0A2Z7AXF9_9LAMI|nr:nuclear transcription factor Y subunit B-10-like [Dorcoceras hygrometricum]